MQHKQKVTLNAPLSVKAAQMRGESAVKKEAGLTSGPASSRRAPLDGSWAWTGCSLFVLTSTHYEITQREKEQIKSLTERR